MHGLVLDVRIYAPDDPAHQSNLCKWSDGTRAQAALGPRSSVTYSKWSDGTRAQAALGPRSSVTYCKWWLVVALALTGSPCARHMVFRSSEQFCPFRVCVRVCVPSPSNSL